MFENIFSLVTHGFGSASIGNVLAQWEASGVFSYMIPFLLIFSIIYGLLTQIKVFGDTKESSGRTINAIIALSVSLLSLQFGFVSRFFSEIFPRLGIALAVLLVVVILLGLFAPNKNWMTYAFFGIGLIILVSVLVNTATAFGYGWNFGFYLQQYSWPIFILIAIVVIVAAATPSPETHDAQSRITKALFGGDKD